MNTVRAKWRFPSRGAKRRQAIGKLSVAPLRALAAHAPYFSDGSAKALDDVVGFYDKRFSIHFTAQEKADLVAFLNAL